ncbi:MAG: hypothetical protein EOO72_11295, partial [Myxococcaceae bacterium]
GRPPPTSARRLPRRRSPRPRRPRRPRPSPKRPLPKRPRQRCRRPRLPRRTAYTPLSSCSSQHSHSHTQRLYSPRRRHRSHWESRSAPCRCIPRYR